MPQISIIVPVYNVENYLRQCVDSILTQTFTDFELILVDDGSTDNSRHICDEISGIDTRIRVIHQANTGQATARNNALKMASGEWIHFVDSDDVIHTRTLEALYNAVRQHNVLISMCGMSRSIRSIEYNNIGLNDIVFSTNAVDEDYIHNLYSFGEHRYGAVWGKLIHKSLVLNEPFTDGKYYEDTAVVCKWLYAAKLIANTDSKLYYYRNTPVSTTNNVFSTKQLDMLWSINETIKFYKEIKYYKMLHRVFVAYMDNAANFYNAHYTFLKENHYLSHFKKEMRAVYRSNHKIICIDKQFDEYISGIIYPTKTKIKCMLNRIFGHKSK